MARPSFEDLEARTQNVVRIVPYVFLDTEFTDLVAEPKLISVGLVHEDGREFYGELAMRCWAAEASPFVRANVVPLLDLYRHGREGEERSNLAGRLAKWLKAFGPVRIVSDAPEYDGGLLVDLFHETLTPWPDNVGGQVWQISALLGSGRQQAAFNEAQEDYFRGRERHHALVDAQALRQAWKAATFS